MSVYVVNLREPGNSKNKTLCEMAQVFRGNIFHRDTDYGCFMVHEEQGVTPDQQRDSIRKYFASHAIPVTEQINETTGHAIFDVDLTAPVKQTEETSVSAKQTELAASPVAPEVLAMAA